MQIITIIQCLHKILRFQNKITMQKKKKNTEMHNVICLIFKTTKLRLKNIRWILKMSSHKVYFRKLHYGMGLKTSMLAT